MTKFTRLRWLLLLVAVPAFLIWLCWPVETYDGYAPTYIAVSEKPEKQFLGVVSVEKFPNPWLAADNMKSQSTPAFKTYSMPDSGIKAVWSTEKKLPRDLFFRRKNLVWKIAPTEKIGDHKRGDTEWLAAIENLANETNRIFTTGTLKSSKIETRKVMRCRLFFEDSLKKYLNFRKWFSMYSVSFR